MVHWRKMRVHEQTGYLPGFFLIARFSGGRFSPASGGHETGYSRSSEYHRQVTGAFCNESGQETGRPGR